MKTILITGAYGFVGTNLARSLQKDYRIWALDINESVKGLYHQFFTWNEVEKIPFEKVDVIIHLAGKAHDTKKRSDARQYFDINTGLTQRIFDLFLSSAGGQFIFFSSVKAAADTVEGDSLTEDIVPKPVGPYGESKIKAEQYLLSKEIGEKKLYILRPCMIHGPGNKGNLNILHSIVSKGIPYPLGRYDNRRSFTSVGNLCFLIQRMLSADNPISSGIYNIADDDPVSTNSLIELICATSGRKPRIWYLPKKLLQAGARVGDTLHLPFNSERMHKLTETYVVDNSKIKYALGIEKLPVNSSEGIIFTVRSFPK